VGTDPGETEVQINKEITRGPISGLVEREEQKDEI
jgi:hypothetical protein